MAANTTQHNLFHPPFLQFVKDNYSKPGTHRFNQYSTFSGIPREGMKTAVNIWNSRHSGKHGKVEYDDAVFTGIYTQTTNGIQGWGNIHESDLDEALKSRTDEQKCYK